ncbi:MAG: FtsK/SpoIIIE domain-containing protein [Bryobacteraceae bacterium]
MPEPVRVPVSGVRREIWRAAGGQPGTGEPSTAMLGSLFHRSFRVLMGPDPLRNWQAVLDPDDVNHPDRLAAHVYETILGPRLRESQASLHGSASQVLSLWEATGHLCGWVCQMLANGMKDRDALSVEEQLEWRIEDPSWPAPVLVTGAVDAVWRNPASRRWCVIDLKLGAGAPEADLAQLCLYHEMLRARPEEGLGEIGLFHFRPALERSTLSEEQIAPVRPKLVALIGRIAGFGRPGAPSPSYAHRELGTRLVQVLEQFGPMVTLENDPVVGPSFLRFHLMPGPGVKVGRILPLGSDIGVQLRLSRPALIRVENGMLVVDLERPDRQTLHFAEVRPSLPQAAGNSSVLVGVDLQRSPHFADLRTDCPHMLVAGTSGSGKSEWLRTAIASMVAVNTPRTLRLMLIDPKRVTFQELSGSPFLLDGFPILSTPGEAISGLERLIAEMERRYRLFASNYATDLDLLNRTLGERALPRIVCFCDEYGNLVAHKKHREPMERAIVQLGAKARAAGIHLVLATQDPRAQILSPALKANLAGRVCLKTTSATQSRMVLEENGAEALLGHGDLLFKTTGEAVRLQAPLLAEQDRAELFGGRG